MAGFLYHAVGQSNTPSPKQIEAWGLSYAFTGRISGAPVNHNGPSGRPGFIFADPSRHNDRTIGCFPDQTWRKMPPRDGRPELWLGYWNDAKPTPEDLERLGRLPSLVSYVMGEGCRWLIPTLTELDAEGHGDCLLPTREDFNDEGELVTLPPEGVMGELWDVVHPVAMGLCGFAGVEYPTHAEQRNAAICLVRANYVVDLFELAVLGCLYRGDNRYADVVMASCRGQWMLDAVARQNSEEKKSEPPSAGSTSDTSAGAAA